MNKRLDELRDKLADMQSRNYPRRYGHTNSFKNGFDAAIAELMPRVKKIFDAAKYANEFVVISKPYMSCEIMKEDAIETEEKLKTALTEWREFMGEG